MSTTVRRATRADAATLAALAAATFRLACPPTTTEASIDDFIARNLTQHAFDRYLADPDRALFLGLVGDEPAGYTMLIFGEPTDADVLASITRRPTAELSKVYVLKRFHGGGVAAELMKASTDEATIRGAVTAWLGVNQLNVRANRFYEKHGFALVGSRRFLVGEIYEDDYVRERIL